MRVIKSIDQMRSLSEHLKKENKRIGFVPTMGFLHEGHLSLIRLAKKQSDVIVVSIFINPTQFGPNEDYNRYPRDFASDEEKCREEAVDILFYPTAEDMYTPNFKTYVYTKDLAEKMCGATRPIHFKGVTTIVAKLFNVVQPNLAVFGQKDAQQNLIIRRMVNDLNFNVDIITGPIIRESDGLAMSSRNKYLSPAERKAALVLYKTLCLAKNLIDQGETLSATIREEMLQMINNEQMTKLDYIAIVDFDMLEPIDTVQKNTLIAIAANVGKTRLIDNILI